MIRLVLQTRNCDVTANLLFSYPSIIAASMFSRPKLFFFLSVCNCAAVIQHTAGCPMINVYKVSIIYDGRCLLRKQVDGSSMTLLGNTQDDDMRIIAELTISRLQALCTAAAPASHVTGRPLKSVDTPCFRSIILLYYFKRHHPESDSRFACLPKALDLLLSR